MKVIYDSKIDALYFDLAKGKYNKSKKITDSIIVDLTAGGKVLGIEILDATDNIQHFNPSNVIVNYQKDNIKNAFAS